MSIALLLEKDLSHLDPLWLEDTFFAYAVSLSDIRGELTDALEYVWRHPLLQKVNNASVWDLYDILQENNNLDLVDGITEEELAALCGNYKVLFDFLQQYNDTYLLYNPLTRRRLLPFQSCVN